MSLTRFIRDVQSRFQAIPAPAAIFYDAIPAKILKKPENKIVDDIAEKIASGIIVDLGSGTGYLSIEIAKRAPSTRVYGIDLSRQMVKIARRHAKGIENVQFKFSDGDDDVDFVDFAKYLDENGWHSDAPSFETTGWFYYHYDGLGSVIALSDEDGNTVETYSYDVYGETNFSSSDVGNPYMFTGRRFDPETGLYYYRARMYNPTIGRFIQVDPIGYEDSMNLYSYCGNNPATLVDPLGLDAYLIYEPHGGPRSFGRAGEKMGHVSIAVDSSDGDGKIVVGNAAYDVVSPPHVLKNLEQASAYGKSEVIRFKNKTEKSWQSWQTSDLRIEQYIYSTGYNNVSERAYIYCSTYAADALNFGGYDLESSGITPEVLVNAAKARSEWDSNIIPENTVK